MLLKAFAVKDIKSGAFTAPYFAPSVGEGERQFLKLARDPNTTIHQFAEDFNLYLVGTYNDADASYNPEKPQHLLDAVQAKNIAH